MLTRSARLAACLAAASLVAACSSSSSGGAPSSKLASIIPASAGLIAGTSPTSDDRVWVLAGTPRVKTLSQLNLRDGKQVSIVPVSADAIAVTASVSGVLCVGTATRRSGAIELRNGSTGALLTTVPVAAPVIDVAAGSDGTTMYVLYGLHGVFTVAEVDSQTGLVEVTLPVLKDAVALAPTPAQDAIYVVSASGLIDEVSTSDGRRLAEFRVSDTGIDLTLAPSGKTMYVLEGPAPAPAIAVIDLAKDAQTSVGPAAANSVGIAPGYDDQHLYDFVGTSAVGNVQLIALHGD